MRQSLSSELLMALMRATPQQMEAIEEILGCESRVEPVAEEVARRVFALIQELEMEGPCRKAPVLQVFRLYCLEGLSRDEGAKRCGWVPSLVSLRLKQIERKLGRKPSELRQYSSQVEQIEESLSDSRAKSVYREGLADELGEEHEN